MLLSNNNDILFYHKYNKLCIKLYIHNYTRFSRIVWINIQSIFSEATDSFNSFWIILWKYVRIRIFRTPFAEKVYKNQTLADCASFLQISSRSVPPIWKEHDFFMRFLCFQNKQISEISLCNNSNPD